jgi:ribosome maturation factor RimP
MKGCIMNQNLTKIKELAIPIIESHGYVLYDIKDVAEYGINIIRIIIDDPETFDMDIDEVAEINQTILDEVNDLLPDDYYLEVSSVGIERELNSDDDFEKAIDKYIYVSCYEKIDNLNEKEFYGDLKSCTEKSITVNVKIKTRYKEITIDKNKIVKARLAVKF